ncbi:MAG: phosphotransferase family protein [Planctomycetota bacterium]
MSHDGPPPADYTINEAEVAGIVAAHCPQLAGRPVRLLGEGYDNRAFEVGSDGGDGERWVFRFPRHKAGYEWVQAERRAMPRIADALPLAVPRFEHSAAAGEYPAAMYGFVAYRRVPGVPCDQLPDATAVDRATAGRQLGEFLRALHAPELATIARECGVPQYAANNLRELAGRSREQLAQVATPHATSAELRHWDAQLLAHANGTPPASDAAAYTDAADRAACLTHADLLPEHMLIDPATGRLTGVIDWSDLQLGDPAGDLVAAFMQVERIDPAAVFAAWCDGAPPPDVHARARLIAACVGILEGPRGHSPADNLRRARLAVSTLRAVWPTSHD